jgi:outer membrane receptor protein involved in Fe transport
VTRRSACAAFLAVIVAAVPLDRLAAQGSSGSALDEIIVTATRRETALKDAPLSIGALSGADLRAIGARDIVDYFEHVPGLNYNEDAFGGYRIIIRGIAAGTFVETRPLSAFYLDETPLMTIASGSAADPQWGGARPQAVDVARVEVLRGPQGTLFGASALGGAVRMITNRPDPRRFDASVDAGYSMTAHGDSGNSMSGVVNVPIVADRLALRAIAYRRDDGGYIDNVESGQLDVNDVTTSGARLALLWNATPALSLLFRAQAQDRSSGGFGAADVAAGPYEQIRYVSEHDDERWRLYTLELNYDLPRARLTFVTSSLDRDPALAKDNTLFIDRILGVFNPTTNVFDDSVDDTIHEVRIASTSDNKISWLGGLYYQHQTRTWHQDQPSPGFDALTQGSAARFGYPDNLEHARFSGTVRQVAAYGEVSYRPSKVWEITAGARWFEFDYGIDDAQDGLLAGGPSPPIRATTDEHGVTPKIGLAYRANDRLLLFANAAQGFRPGGTNEFTNSQVEHCAGVLAGLGLAVPPSRGYESDSLWNFEVGAKTTWLNERLAADATVYHIRWDDMQTPRTLFCPMDAMNLIENVGKATSDGAELELSWRPLDWLQIGFGAARTNARLAADAPTIVGTAGEPLPTVPEWTFEASIESQFRFTGRVRGFVRADYTGVDSSWSDYDEAVRRLTPSRKTLDLRLGARFDKWWLELYADNVLDERGVLLYTNNIVGEWQALTTPRTIGLHARVEF